MAKSTVARLVPKSPSAFQNGWCSLPAELRLQILSYVLTVPDHDSEGNPISELDCRLDAHSAYEDRFRNIALPLLACPQVDAVFNLPQAAFALWYGNNTFFFGSDRIGGFFDDYAYYHYLTPHHNAFAYLQDVEVYIIADYAGWHDLASYCKITKEMPRLKMFKVEFVHITGNNTESKSLMDALAAFGPLTVSSRKFVLDYHGLVYQMGRHPPFTQHDRGDYAGSSSVFHGINIEVVDNKVTSEEFVRYWYNYILKTMLQTDESWVPLSIGGYRGPLNKRIVRTQWQ